MRDSTAETWQVSPFSVVDCSNRLRKLLQLEQELRGSGIAGDLLYVVNAYKKYSQILIYQAAGNGDYRFKEVFASKDTINVVTGLKSADSPLQIASHLQQQYPSPDEFLTGTIVASSIGSLPGVSKPMPPDVS